MSITCTKFKSFSKGSLIGFANFYLSKSGLEVNGCSVFQKNGHRWIIMPNREYKDRDTGEIKFSPVVKYKDPKLSKLFSKHGVLAIEKWCHEKPSEKQHSNKRQKHELHERADLYGKW